MSKTRKGFRFLVTSCGLFLFFFLNSSSSFDLDYDFQRDYYDRWVKWFHFPLSLKEKAPGSFVAESNP